MNQDDHDQPGSEIKRSDLVHELRDRLNTIVTSAMVLDRVGAVTPEHQKYLDWILEKANEANDLVRHLEDNRESQSAPTIAAIPR